MTLIATRVFIAGLFALGSLGAQVASPPPNAPNNTARPAPARRSGANAGSVRGVVKDGSGAIIRGASVTLATGDGTVQTVTTGADGSYTFRGVDPGTYTVSATYSGLQQEGIAAVTVAPNQPATANLTMTVQTKRQEVTVTDTATNTVSTEPANNATALVLKPEDLDALPDDPDDLSADLQALAGPAAGPGGNQIYIDGFTGGRLPPKESIREIRINSNPFSAEFDKLGYGRIQIFTKPGSDRFHGQGYYTISDGVWNSRNPFLTVNPPFRTQLFGGNVSGPLTKKGSFFIDVERRQIDDNGIVTATIPTADFLSHLSYQTYYPTPQRRTTVSPRVDYQLGSNNTLSFRYAWLENDRIVTGIGGFKLPDTTIGNINFPSSGYSYPSNENNAQIVDTAVLSPKAINETRFQFERESYSYVSQSLAPQLRVAQSFTSGGSGYGAPGYPNTYDNSTNYELQNYTSVTWGAHTTKFGIRIRANQIEDSSPQGFNGTYQFLGGTFPLLSANDTIVPGQTVNLQSIQQYLITVQLLSRFSSDYITNTLHYGPSKYSINAGNPYLSFYQLDFGPFVQDDWKVRPNLTVSLGLRWESQTNIYDKNDWAPRIGFAWSPDARGANARPKTVVRGGWGYFYDRFAATNVLTAYRYNQSNQTAYVQDNPATYDAAFDTQILPQQGLTNVVASAAQRYQIDHSLKTPRLMQTAISVERQLFGHTTLNANFVNSRGTHELRTRDINAPVPIPGLPPPGSLAYTSGVVSGLGFVRPYGSDIGDIYNYESSGIFKQTQVMVGVNSQVGKWFTLFSRYSYTNAHSDTDGLGTLPANSYNVAAEWGRSNLDIEHNLFLGGSVSAKWGLRFSPFLVAHSGTPYNITTGTDLFLQGTGTPTARPEVVSYTTPYDTPFGYLNAQPLVAAPGTSNMIGRNAGTSAGFIGLNLRVSKTFGFGTTKFKGPSGGARAGGGGGGRGGGGGGFGGFGGETTEHRYNLTLSVNARNILNHENLNTFNGALTSPYFMQPTGITGGYGAESTASNQRRLDLQIRFSF